NEALKKYGIDENTLVVFASDNGAYWPEEEIELHHHDSNQRRKGQKGDIWEGGHHIPLIVTWPAIIKKPSTYSQLVSLTDFFSTFSELTGNRDENNSGEDSFSFLHVLRG